jgi:hypothetical protein
MRTFFVHFHCIASSRCRGKIYHHTRRPALLPARCHLAPVFVERILPVVQPICLALPLAGGTGCPKSVRMAHVGIGVAQPAERRVGADRPPAHVKPRSQTDVVECIGDPFGPTSVGTTDRPGGVVALQLAEDEASGSFTLKPRPGRNMRFTPETQSKATRSSGRRIGWTMVLDAVTPGNVVHRPVPVSLQRVCVMIISAWSTSTSLRTTPLISHAWNSFVMILANSWHSGPCSATCGTRSTIALTSSGLTYVWCHGSSACDFSFLFCADAEAHRGAPPGSCPSASDRSDFGMPWRERVRGGSVGFVRGLFALFYLRPRLSNDSRTAPDVTLYYTTLPPCNKKTF